MRRCHLAALVLAALAISTAAFSPSPVIPAASFPPWTGRVAGAPHWDLTTFRGEPLTIHLNALLASEMEAVPADEHTTTTSQQRRCRRRQPRQQRSRNVTAELELAAYWSIGDVSIAVVSADEGNAADFLFGNGNEGAELNLEAGRASPPANTMTFMQVKRTRSELAVRGDVVGNGSSYIPMSRYSEFAVGSPYACFRFHAFCTVLDVTPAVANASVCIHVIDAPLRIRSATVLRYPGSEVDIDATMVERMAVAREDPALRAVEASVDSCALLVLSAVPATSENNNASQGRDGVCRNAPPTATVRFRSLAVPGGAAATPKAATLRSVTVPRLVDASHAAAGVVLVTNTTVIGTDGVAMQRIPVRFDAPILAPAFEGLDISAAVNVSANVTVECVRHRDAGEPAADIHRRVASAALTFHTEVRLGTRDGRRRPMHRVLPAGGGTVEINLRDIDTTTAATAGPPTVSGQWMCVLNVTVSVPDGTVAVARGQGVTWVVPTSDVDCAPTAAVAPNATFVGFVNGSTTSLGIEADVWGVDDPTDHTAAFLTAQDRRFRALGGLLTPLAPLDADSALNLVDATQPSCRVRGAIHAVAAASSAAPTATVPVWSDIVVVGGGGGSAAPTTTRVTGIRRPMLRFVRESVVPSGGGAAGDGKECCLWHDRLRRCLGTGDEWPGMRSTSSEPAGWLTLATFGATGCAIHARLVVDYNGEGRVDGLRQLPTVLHLHVASSAPAIAGTTVRGGGAVVMCAASVPPTRQMVAKLPVALTPGACGVVDSGRDPSEVGGWLGGPSGMDAASSAQLFSTAVCKDNAAAHAGYRSVPLVATDAVVGSAGVMCRVVKHLNATFATAAVGSGRAAPPPTPGEFGWVHPQPGAALAFRARAGASADAVVVAVARRDPRYQPVVPTLRIVDAATCGGGLSAAGSNEGQLRASLTLGRAAVATIHFSLVGGRSRDGAAAAFGPVGWGSDRADDEDSDDPTAAAAAGRLNHHPQTPGRSGLRGAVGGSTRPPRRIRLVPHDFGTSTAGGVAREFVVPELALLGSAGTHAAGIFTPVSATTNQSSGGTSGGGGFRCAMVRIRGADVAAGRVPRRFALVADSATGTVSNPVEVSIDLFGDEATPTTTGIPPPAAAAADDGRAAGAMVGAVLGVVFSVAAVVTLVLVMLSRRRAAVRRRGAPTRQPARKLAGRVAMDDDDDADDTAVGMSDVGDDNEVLCPSAQSP